MVQIINTSDDLVAQIDALGVAETVKAHRKPPLPTRILRDLYEDAGLGRLYLPREALLHAGITSNDPNRVIAERALPKVCLPLAQRAKSHFEKSDEIMNRNKRRAVRAPRIMSKYYHSILDLLIARGFTAPREPVRVSKITRILILLRYAFI